MVAINCCKKFKKSRMKGLLGDMFQPPEVFIS